MVWPCAPSFDVRAYALCLSSLGSISKKKIKNFFGKLKKNYIKKEKLQRVPALESITWEKWSRLIKSPFDFTFISFRGRWQQDACEEYNYFFCLRPAIEWPALPCCTARTREESDVLLLLGSIPCSTIFLFVRTNGIYSIWFPGQILLFEFELKTQHSTETCMWLITPRQTAYSDFIATFLL